MAALELRVIDALAEVPQNPCYIDSGLLKARQFSALPGPVDDLIIGNFNEILKNWVVRERSVRF